MNSTQYEELCRFYIATKLGIAVDAIKSVLIPSPTRPDLPKYKHQIDLYWEAEDEISKYLNIANAKWRGPKTKIDQPEILLLQQVKQKVGAHKAIMITNTGFTSGADAAAQDDGIGTHIVVPAFDFSKLPEQNREQIQQVLRDIQSVAVEVIYHSDIAHKAIDIELIENNSSIERLDSSDSLVLSALKQRVGYLWMLSAQGHAVDMGEISRLEAEIAQIRSSARG